MRGRLIYRKEALIRSAQPVPLDGMLRVTAPHDRLFSAALAFVLLTLVALVVLTV